MAAKITDIINARSQDYILPERIRSARDTTQGATDELYTNNVIETLGGERNLPFWIEGVKTAPNPTIPVIGEVLKVIGLTDDEGASKGKGRTALQKFIEDFPKMQKEWKETVEGDEKWGERGWKTVKDLWKATVHDKMLEDIKTERAKAVDDAESVIGWKIPGSTAISTFITKLLLPRVTEHIANTGDFQLKDLALDVGENLAMSVPGAMWTGAPVKAASIVGKGLAKAGLGNTAASRVLANLPGHITNLSNKIAGSWGKNLPGNIALGIGRTGRNFAGNAVVPFAMEGIDDYAYDEGEGMDQRADFSAGDALTGAITNQVVNRSLARLGQAVIPEAAGSVEVRSPAVLKMREFLKTLGESSHKPGDEFASSVRATASRNATPSGTYTPADLSSYRSGGTGVTSITPEEKAEAILNREVLDAIDRGEIRLLPKETADRQMALQKLYDEYMARQGIDLQKAAAASNSGKVEKVADKAKEHFDKFDELKTIHDGLQRNHREGLIGDADFEREITPIRQAMGDEQRLGRAALGEMRRLQEESLNNLNKAKREALVSGNTLYGKADDVFTMSPEFYNRLGYVDPSTGVYNSGIPYSSGEIFDAIENRMPEFVNYANWHGKPSVEPSRMRKILGLTENPTAKEVLLNDAKQAVPTWAVNKAGRADMTKNLLRRIDATDSIKKEQEAAHAAPGQRVRSKTAKNILDANRGELSDKSRKYLAYLEEHPDAVKTGHSDPKERSDFNLWLLTEGRDLLEGTPLHRPTWEVK